MGAVVAGMVVRARRVLERGVGVGERAGSCSCRSPVTVGLVVAGAGTVVWFRGR